MLHQLLVNENIFSKAAVDVEQINYLKVCKTSLVPDSNPSAQDPPMIFPWATV